MSKNQFPPGWDDERAREVIAHYEGQTDEEAAAEDEAAFGDPEAQTVVQVPSALLPAIRQLIAEHEKERQSR